MALSPRPLALQGLTVFERGWLSSNNVLLHGGDGAVLVDSSHTLHGEQTVALLRQALQGAPLLRIVNTHLHSDHCGGNAAVQREWACRISTPPGHHAAARAWDEDLLGYRACGQICERFSPDDCIGPGQTLEVGGRRWLALAAQGHDPHSIILFDADQGVLISADALWQNGFGVVFPELDGEGAFGEVGRTLDLIESLDARWVIPGHGAPFEDVADALQRARSRLAAFVADPARHAQHALRVIFKYHLLEVQSQDWAALDAWVAQTSLCTAIWQKLGRPEGSLQAYGRRTVQALVANGAAAVQGERVLNV